MAGPDILVANRADDGKGPNYVCFNKGKGQFDADCLAFSQESATTITPADINGDGVIDLIVPIRNGGQSYVYINDGKGAFGKRIPFGPNDPEILLVTLSARAQSGSPKPVDKEMERSLSSLKRSSSGPEILGHLLSAVRGGVSSTQRALRAV